MSSTDLTNKIAIAKAKKRLSFTNKTNVKIDAIEFQERVNVNNNSTRFVCVFLFYKIDIKEDDDVDRADCDNNRWLIVKMMLFL
jgi:hypothetical protein